MLVPAVGRDGVLYHQLSRGGGEADAVLGYAGEGAGVLREDLLDDESGTAVIVVIDVEVLGGFNDGGLAEPGDLRAGVAFHTARKFGGCAVSGCDGLNAFQDTRRSGLLTRLRS